MSRLFRNKISWPLFWLLLSAFYALTAVLLEFVGIPENHLSGFLALFVQWAVVSVVAAGVLGLISANRIVFAVLFPILLVLSGIQVYYRHALGAAITGTTIEIAFQNNLGMWLSVIDFRMICVFLFTAAIAAAICVYRWKRVVFTPGPKSYVSLGVSLILAVLPFAVPRISGSVNSRMPYALYEGLREYMNNYEEAKTVRDTFDGERVIPSPTPPDVIFVLGETLRADHVPMNGYERQTMPYMSRERNLVSFPHMKSTGFHTAISLPYIMTRADSLCTETGYEEQSFISLFRRAGYRSSWIANQDISPSYSYFAHEPDTLIHVNSMRSLYSYDRPWLDVETLPHFDRWYGADPSTPALAVIHSIGSHWWYKAHYESRDAVFVPDMDSKERSALSPEQIINSYDNSIVATDRFLGQLIDRLRHKNAVVIFVSDHGESMGEDGRWLHATDAGEVHDAAFFVWFSDRYGELFPDKVEALRRHSASHLSSDDLFHSVLDAAALRTRVLAKDKSIFHEKEN